MKQNSALQCVAGNARAFVQFVREKPCFFGMGFYYAWLYLSFYSTSLFPASDQTFSLVDSTWAFGAWGFAIFLAFYLAFLRKTLRQCSQRSLIWAAFGITSAGTAIAALPALAAATPSGWTPAGASLFPEWQKALAVVGMTASGASSAGIVILWGSSYKELNTREILSVASGSMVIGALIFIAAAGLPSLFVSILSVAFPFMSGACFMRCGAYEPAKSKASSNELAQSETNSSKTANNSKDRNEIVGCDERQSANANEAGGNKEEGNGEAHTTDARKTSRTGTFSARLLIPFLALFAFSLGGEVLRSLCSVLGDPAHAAENLHTSYIASQGIGGGLWLALSFAMSNSLDLETAALKLARPAFVTMAAAFAILCFAPLSPSTSYGIFGLGFQYVRVFAFAMAVDTAKRCEFSPATAVAFVHLPAALAPCASPAILPVASLLAAGSALDWNIVFMAFTCAMFVTALFVLNEKDFLTVWGMAKAPSPQTAPGSTNAPSIARMPGTENLPCAPNATKTASTQDSASFIDAAQNLAEPSSEERFRALAATWHLTKRETEVAFLLAKGRNLPYIEEKLVISHGTAQTHQRHIYEKTGAHSRQEFLDLIERSAEGRSSAE